MSPEDIRLTVTVEIVIRTKHHWRWAGGTARDREAEEPRNTTAAPVIDQCKGEVVVVRSLVGIWRQNECARHQKFPAKAECRFVVRKEDVELRSCLNDVELERAEKRPNG